MHADILIQIAIVAATIGGLLARALRQPPILGPLARELCDRGAGFVYVAR